jgi:hypothetical protein
MIGNDSRNSGAMNVEHLQNSALNTLELICSVLCRPLDMICRPWHGTRYFQVPVVFATSILMILLPVIAAVYLNIAQMIPFMSVPVPRGLFGFAALAKLYFAMSVWQGYRHWQAMLHMEREPHSEFEGPPLPVFNLIPWFSLFWRTRILAEPLFILILTTVLEDFFLIQSPLALYLRIAAFALGMKNFVAWFRSWEYLRRLIDIANAGPAMADLIEGKATEEQLAPMHLASFPKDIDPAIGRTAAVNIARAYTAGN